MKLITPEVGWAADGQRLFWTTNGGGEWSEITPRKPSAEEHIASVFFLDTSVGWVLLSRYAETGTRFDLVCTTDAGQSWSAARLNVPDPDPARGLSGQAWVDFVDPLHGWVMVRTNGNTAVYGGVLLRTEDGGQTWKWPRRGPPTAGPMRFATAKQGWLAGGPDGELYVTRDGGESWGEVSLPVPPGVHLASETAVGYGLPTLLDRQHGYLQAFYSDGSNVVSALVATGDGGQTWKFDRILPRVIEAASIVVNSTWIAASSLGGHTLTLTKVALGGAAAETTTVRADVSRFQGLRGVGGEEISFADLSHGWVLPGKLLATADGGTTWSEITPPQLKPPGPPPVFVKTPRAALSRQPSPARAAASHYAFSSTPDLSIHLAFDSTDVLCTIPVSSCSQAQSIAYMQTWWNSSPYFDTGLYLPGSPNRHTDPNLTANNAATWVAAIQKQGWGLFPIWFGFQAPCACREGSYPNCTIFYSSYMSSNTATAATQGQQEADQAIGVVKNIEAKSSSIALGTIIYHDLEIYTPSSTCSPAVQAFLGGWVSEMHTKGFQAGVYANPSPIQSDVSQVSPLPDDIWVAKYDNRVTTLGLGFSDSLWPKDQRIHQYQQSLSQTYGGTPNTLTKIDPDIDDAQIAAGLGAKSYPGFNFSEIAYPGAAQTVPQGINNKNSSGGFINAGQTGEVVGAYYNSTGPVNAFLDNSGTFSNVNDPNATNGSVAYDIGDQGYIVGAYGSSTVHGYLKKGTATPTDINCTGATDTYAIGINDDGQIVGYDVDSVGIHGFFLRTSTGTCQTYDGLFPNNAQAIGINGSGQIVGFYRDSTFHAHGFLWNEGTDGSIATLDIGGAAQTQLFYINNNGQITGQYQDASGNWHSFLYEEATGSYQTLPDDPNACSPGCSGVVGVNDSAQVIGQYSTVVAGPSHGFLATPQ
jgi:photosystem II stability/assembly factor-like uncharacterized protein/uncharacterized membrane protein